MPCGDSSGDRIRYNDGGNGSGGGDDKGGGGDSGGRRDRGGGRGTRARKGSFPTGIGGDGGHERLTNGAADDDDAAAGVPALY